MTTLTFRKGTSPALLKYGDTDSSSSDFSPSGSPIAFEKISFDQSSIDKTIQQAKKNGLFDDASSSLVSKLHSNKKEEEDLPSLGKAVPSKPEETTEELQFVRNIELSSSLIQDTLIDTILAKVPATEEALVKKYSPPVINIASNTAKVTTKVCKTSKKAKFLSSFDSNKELFSILSVILQLIVIKLVLFT